MAAERTRRRAQRPRLYALLFTATMLIVAGSAAGVWLAG